MASRARDVLDEEVTDLPRELLELHTQLARTAPSKVAAFCTVSTRRRL